MENDLERFNSRCKKKLEEDITVFQVRDDNKLDQPAAHQGGQMNMDGTVVGDELAMEGIG